MQTIFPCLKAPVLPKPDIVVDGTHVRNLTHDDIYFSAENGFEETEYVFLQQNQLPARFHGRLRFSIGEIGFGTGLNFLASWKAFEDNITEPDARLFYISTERAPLLPEQLEQALALFPQLAPYAKALMARYPIRMPGWHRITFDRVILWLGYGDAADLLSDFHAKVDAWFLDGFAPAKNTDAWDTRIFKEIARLSEEDATLATFTAAGSVQKSLQQAGFAPQKTKGYGKKRDMLTARRTGKRARFGFAVPQVAIIGGGIAGASTAHALAMRGAQTSLLEAETLGSKASGNPKAVLFPRLTKQFSAEMQESFLGYAHILREITALGGFEDGWASQTGMLKYPKSLEERGRLYSTNSALGLDNTIAHWVTYEEASAYTGLKLNDGGLWYPHGTMLEPLQLVRAYGAHERVRINEHAQVEDVTPYAEGYLIRLKDGACAATHVVFANAAAALSYHITEHLPLRVSAGQLSFLPKSETTAELKAIFCHKGYIVPMDQEQYLMGASYDHDDISLKLKIENHQRNLANLQFYAPGFVKGKPTILHGRISHRTSVPGHNPLTGRLYDAQGALVPHAYTSLAHGSRGMISAPYAAEKIAAQIYDEPRPKTWL